MKSAIRKDCSDEMEIIKQQILFFELPRRLGAQMAPIILDYMKMNKSALRKILRILRMILKRNNVKDVLTTLNYLFHMDKSEEFFHYGEFSKYLYYQIFNARDYNLYGAYKKQRDLKMLNAERWEKELRNKAIDLGIEFIWRLGPTDFTKSDRPIENIFILDIFSDKLSEIKRPILTTNKWELEYSEVKNPPLVCSRDPGLVYKSEGNEKYFSYKGEWERGNMDGNGRYQYLDGCSYTGHYTKNW